MRRVTLLLPLRAAILIVVCVGGCKRTPAAQAEDSAKVATRAAAMLPGDPRLAGLYHASCQNCHGHPESGAPPTGYRFAWAPRWSQGLPKLLAHAIGGYNGMPAGGQCFTCTSDDYKALIRFMAARPMDAN